MKAYKIYLAGPDVFRHNAIEKLNSLKQLCEEQGFEGLAPLDNVIEVSTQDAGTSVHSNLIFKANLEMIKKCDVIIANLDPFRGACIDDGTAWEIGCGYALGKLIIGYSKYSDKSLAEVTDEMFDLNNQPKYSEVENFGNSVNLMICDSIKNSGGRIFKTFEECLTFLGEKSHDAFMKEYDNEKYYTEIMKNESKSMDEYYDRFGDN